MSAASPTRCAVYLRVSKDDDSQTTENQLLDLDAYADARGWDVTERYVDRASGGKGRADRRDFDRMMGDGLRREFDVLLFWALDRLTREGVSTTFAYVEQLADSGVSVHSYTQPLLSTASENKLVRDIVLAVLAAVAEDERARISERTKAGLRRARKAGKTLGRPSKFEEHQATLAQIISSVEMRVETGELGRSEAGQTARREGVEATGLSYNTVSKYLLRLGLPGPAS
ncbi:recombinase family protein [Rubrivirga litoralis]|uniref:Recombinase family protein n=1 Tax=Rubrivirga litoralis TaxID=3075598 RepID=A0ABU3BUH2_9BACT|nr:recombinase family protein [Rubrivirga sp. F394]MDT0632940.1 recombinase family protein [Rubrivirga sp. F394]